MAINEKASQEDEFAYSIMTILKKKFTFNVLKYLIKKKK
jgi:hypothetical protein